MRDNMRKRAISIILAVMITIGVMPAMALDHSVTLANHATVSEYRHMTATEIFGTELAASEWAMIGFTRPQLLGDTATKGDIAYQASTPYIGADGTNYGEINGIWVSSAQNYYFIANTAGTYTFTVLYDDEDAGISDSFYVTLTVDPVAVAPTVTTEAAADITQTTATGNGNITSLGSPNPTGHGFVWGTSVNPTVESSAKTQQGAASVTGAFTGDITGLAAGTTYHVRAYATNSAGTSYGSDVTFETAAAATSDTWDGSVASGFAGGSGSSGAPYRIATAEQLARVANLVNSETENANYGDKYYILTVDLDLDNRQWTPIGNTSDLDGTNFKGSFDGDGHTISNLVIGTSGSPNVTFANAGLFGYVYRGTVSDLSVLDVAIYSAGVNAGGLVGYWNGTSGIATPVTNCCTTGSVSGGSSSCVGGLIGMSGYCSVSNCFSTCGVTGGDDAAAGGLLGMTGSTGSVTSCFATGDVSTSGSVGCAGGLVGIAQNPLANCYAAGDTTSSESAYAGGLIGYIDGGTITGCYYNSTANAKGVGAVTDDATPITSADMKSQDFVDSLNTTGYSGVWEADAGANQGYPVLTAVQLEVTDTAPVVTTGAATDIVQTTATGNGNLTSLGVPNPTAYGVCWNTAGNPTVSDSKKDLGAATATGAFTAAITGLAEDTTYYVRAFATNSVETVYGGEVSFTTLEGATVPTTTVNGASLSADTGASGTDFVTSVASQTISGTLSATLAAGEKVEVSYNNGGTWSDATYTVGSAAWSAAAVLSGSSTFKACVSNIAGSSTAYSHTYIYDAAAPAAPSAPDMTADTDTGASSEDNITCDTTPTFEGTTEALSAVALYDTDVTTVLGTGTANGSGEWSITASTLAPGAHTVTAKATDAAGNMSAASTGLSLTIDTAGPLVTSVSVPANGTYKTGDALTFAVSWDENVTVDTMGGTPRLALDIGGVTRYANYLIGSDTSNLVFRYMVMSGDYDSNGITVSAAQLYGGTIRDTASNDATLTLNSVGSTAGILVDAVAPTVSSVSVPSNGTYAAGDNLDFTVNMSENVTVITTGGTPRIALVVGATTRYADYLGGTGTTALTFRYTVPMGDMDSNGITVGALSANGGTLRDAIGNNATLTLNSVGSTVNVLVDGVGPVVTSVAVPASGTYAVGDSLDFIVSWGENITVNTAGGTPQIALVVGATTRYAVYRSGSGTTALTFRYTVPAGDMDSNGITVGALIANGGTLRDAISNDATLTLNSVGSTVNVLVDGVGPAVTSVTVPTNGTYVAGDSLSFTVSFGESVTVNTADGTPRISLTIGSATRYAIYIGGNGTSALTFIYTVASGDSDADGIAVGTLSANGGTIQDAVSNDATLTLNSIGSTANVLVDAADPSVTSVLVPADGTYVAGDYLDFTVHFNENVTVNTVGGTPYVALTIGSSTVQAAYRSGTGTSALTFRYTVAAGDTDTDGIAVGVLDANGGTIRDAAANNATLTMNSVGSTASILVDAVAPDAPQAPDLAAASDTGVLDTDDITADTTPTFEGSAETNCTVTLYSDAVMIGTTTADGSGNWSFTAPLALTEGTHSITAAATDGAGNVSAASVGLSIEIDTVGPAAGGAITVTSITKFRVSLTWPSGTDAGTDALALMYKVVYSTSDNITSVTNAELNGTTGIDWTANITSATVSGLTPNTAYYVNVLVKDEAGNITAYAPISQKTASSSNDDSDSDRQDTAGAPVIVNGETRAAGTTQTTTDGSGHTVTTVTVDTDRLADILEAEDSGALVVIPFDEDVGAAVGVLRGDMVAAMADREASLVIRAGSSSYTLPAVELDIEAIAIQFGENVPLSAITVSVGISQPSDEMATVIRNAARDGGFTLVIPGVEFTVTCRYGGRTVEVVSFKAFVERTVAIPDGVDPSKITTGIVVEPDGTVRHVPTRITVIDGKYYAVINSLTNSVYAVVWNPVEFADVTEHWAKDAINDMGSRMVVNGIDNSHFEPDRNMTRAEFAAIIVRALGLAPLDGESAFADVAGTQWYCGYIETAAAYGIITGYDDKTFGPSDLITREQAMTMISRAMQLTGLGADQSADEMAALLAAFSDDAQVSSYAKAGIAACLETGVVSGTTQGTLAPKAFVTRAEVAVMVKRLLQKAGLI